jgi:DNA-binding NtrC family response regulator
MNIIPNKLEVLVVDDESLITTLIENYLRYAVKNANIHALCDPLKALEFLRRYRVDILITDHKMPRCNGIQLMEAAHHGTKKIMISGCISKSVEEKLHSLNAIFIEKPISMKVLAGIITAQEFSSDPSNNLIRWNAQSLHRDEVI